MAIALGHLRQTEVRPGTSQFGKAVMIGIPMASLIGGVGTPAGSSINILGLTIIETERRRARAVPALDGDRHADGRHPAPAGGLGDRCSSIPREIESIGDIGEIDAGAEALGSDDRERMEGARVHGRDGRAAGSRAPGYPVFDITLVAICGAVACSCPASGLFSWKQVQQSTGWDTLLMIGGVTSLGIASPRDRARKMAGRRGARRNPGLERRLDHRGDQRVYGRDSSDAADRPGDQRRDDSADHGCSESQRA